MRKAICAMALLVAGWCFAGDAVYVFEITGTASNTVITNLSGTAIMGEIREIYITVTPMGGCSQMDFSTVSNGNFTAKPMKNISTPSNTVYYPTITINGTNYYYPIINQQIQVLSQGMTANSKSAKALIYYKSP